jgi:hypothetical protein
MKNTISRSEAPNVIDALANYSEADGHLVVSGHSWSVQKKPSGFLNWLKNLFTSREKRKEKAATLINKLLEDLTHQIKSKELANKKLCISFGSKAEKSAASGIQKLCFKIGKHTESAKNNNLHDIGKLFRGDLRQLPEFLKIKKSRKPLRIDSQHVSLTFIAN